MSDVECVCCGQARGAVYKGPVYAPGEYRELICPWCIFDGSAHERLQASFVDISGVGGYGKWDPVPLAAAEEVAYRTPGFCGWQQEEWWTHCGDAAEFVGPAGHRELEALGEDAVASLRDAAGFVEGPEWDGILASLHREGWILAFLFRCSKCGRLGGYVDFN